MQIKKTQKGKRVTASTAPKYDTKLIAKWLKAKFDDEAFGTAYTMHRISDADAYMGRNQLTYNRRNNTIDLIGKTREEDTPIYKVIPQYSHPKRQGTYPPKLPKIIPIEEYNATHNVTGSTRISAADYNPHLIKLAPKDKKYVLDKLNKSFKSLGETGVVGDPYHWESEFQSAATGLWASDKGLQILDDAGIDYELVSPSIECSTELPTIRLTPRQLIAEYQDHNPNGHCFDRDTLKFFGERIGEMKVAPDLVEVNDYRGRPHLCYALTTYQHNAPGGTLEVVHYFDKDTFEMIHV